MEMKANLLKTMLCAVVAALPVGAWAAEVSVSTEKTWTFDELTPTTQYKTYTEIDGLYLRTTAEGRSFTVTSGSLESLVFNDGYQGQVSNYLHVNSSASYSGDNALTATSTAGDGQTKGTGMIAINATVAGTFYVKIKGGTSGKVIRLYFANGTTLDGGSNTSINSDGTIQELSYTSTGAGSFFVGGLTTGTTDIYTVRFVPTTKYGTQYIVRNESTWTFNDYALGDMYTANSAFAHKNGLYARSIKDRKFTIESDAATTLSFSDGYVVTVNQKATMNTATPSGNSSLTGAAGTAATASNDYTPSFAVNASEQGALYVYAKGKTTTKTSKLRIYFVGNEESDAITQLRNVEATSDDAIVEVTGTSSKAGTFYFVSLDNSCEVYAIRFVPTSVSENTTVVYIGETGYATFANNGGVDIPALPEGFSAYAATASEDGHSVVLSPRAGMRRTNGYVVAGTPNTNYRLTYSGEALGSEYSGGEMKRAQAAGDVSGNGYKINQTSEVTESGATVTKNNYILGADGGSAKFFKPGNGSVLAKTKAFLQTSKDLTPAAGAPGLNIIIANNNATGINEVKGSEFKVQGDGAYYNLNGQRVAQPTKGLYIVNGRKVVLK